MSATSEPKPGHWAVYDMNQKGDAPRVHASGGRDYSLWSQKPTHMPMQHAVIFLRDPAFHVESDEGVPQVSLPDSENLDAAKRRPVLEPGETVAKYEELTMPALRARVAVRPGGQDFDSTTKRTDLIEFLIGTPAFKELREHEKPRGTGSVEMDPGSEEMGDDAAKRMLEGG